MTATQDYSKDTEMDTNILKGIFAKHRREGCFIVSWGEWEDKVRKAYAELINIAQKVPYDKITITYSELGQRIDLFPLSDNFHLKIAWILYACATYAFEHGLPLITALVVNSETHQPGKGFWGLEGIPVQLRKVTKIEDITPFKISGERDKFWVEELRKIDMWGKTTNQ